MAEFDVNNLPPDVKAIYLGKGQYTIVDSDDIERLVTKKWWVRYNHAGYPYAKSNTSTGPYDEHGRKRTSLAMHRFIMNAPSGMQVDHINHNSLDNRKTNLRICTHAQNRMNSKKKSGTLSKYKGVQKNYHKWTAHIKHGQKQFYLGSFPTEEIAAMVYNNKAQELFGDFANLNIIEDVE